MSFRSPLIRVGGTAVAVATAALMAACATTPPDNPQISEARGALRAASANPQVARAAALELQQAEAALTRAEQAWRTTQDIDETRHLAYLARQRVAIANEVGARYEAEQRVQQAGTERERVRAEARQREAQIAEQRARAAQHEATLAQQQASAAQQQAAQAQLQMQTARAQAESAGQRARQLEEALQQLEAKQTQRGLVVTLGDVLFDTGSAQLRSGALRSLERLASVLRDYPERRVLIEGFTDSTGSASTNLALSERRADSVRQALMLQGVPPARIEVRAFGQAHPVASNDTPEGRQLNRRVEVVFSDESGRFASR